MKNLERTSTNIWDGKFDMRALTEFLSTKVKNNKVLDDDIDYRTENICLVENVKLDRLILIWIGVNVHDSDSIRSSADRHELSTLFVQEDNELSDVEYAKLLEKHKDDVIDVIVAEDPDKQTRSFINFKLDAVHLQIYSFEDINETVKSLEMIK